MLPRKNRHSGARPTEFRGCNVPAGQRFTKPDQRPRKPVQKAAADRNMLPGANQFAASAQGQARRSKQRSSWRRKIPSVARWFRRFDFSRAEGRESNHRPHYAAVGRTQLPGCAWETTTRPSKIDIISTVEPTRSRLTVSEISRYTAASFRRLAAKGTTLLDFEPLDQFQQRRKKLKEIEALGHAAYPHRFDSTHTPKANCRAIWGALR